jgi:hypothetical protein
MLSIYDEAHNRRAEQSVDLLELSIQASTHTWCLTEPPTRVNIRRLTKEVWLQTQTANKKPKVTKDNREHTQEEVMSCTV